MWGLYPYIGLCAFGLPETLTVALMGVSTQNAGSCFRPGSKLGAPDVWKLPYSHVKTRYISLVLSKTPCKTPVESAVKEFGPWLI